MKIFYRFLLVAVISTTAFFVSGKNSFFHPQQEKEEKSETTANQKAIAKKHRYQAGKDGFIDSLPANAARTAGAASLSAVKTVDKATALAGDTLTYTITVQNNSIDTAKGVTLTDNVDVNTTALADSLWYSPIAIDDTFSCLGNVGITVPAASGVLANDQVGMPLASLTAFTRSTTKGGTVTLNADGSFDYTPAAGYSGTDTIQYLLGNRVRTDVGVITISIQNVVWFINNNSAAATANGTLAAPFKTVAAFQTLNNGGANNPKAGHAIFIAESATAYDGNITLLSGQKLIGQDASADITTVAGFYLPPFSKTLPAMNAANGVKTTLITTAANTNVVNLTAAGTNYLIRGLSIGNKTGKGIFGSNSGILNVTETSISGSGQALDLTNLTLASPGALTNNFETLSSTSGTYGVYLNGVSGTLAVGSSISALSGNTTTAFVVTGGGATITYPGSVSGNRPVDIQNTAGANITFSGNITATVNGINLAGNNGSTLVFSGASKSLNTSTNTAVNATNNSASTISFTGGGLVINTTTGAGFNVTGSSSATSGGSSITVAGTGNTITVAGPASYTGGTALNVSNATIGSGGLNFKSISSNNAQKGIVLSNTGATGGLTIAGAGTAASGGLIQNVNKTGIEINNAKNINLNYVKVLNANQAVTEEGGIVMTDLQGTCLFQNCVFTDARYRNGYIQNSNGSLTLRLTACDFTFSTATTNGDMREDCFEMRTKNSATATVVITNSLFKRAGTKGIQLFAENNSVMNASIAGCIVDRLGGQMAGVEVGSSQSGTMRANVDGNALINATNEVAINLYADGTSAAKTEATVRNNTSVSGYGDVNLFVDPTIQTYAATDAKAVVLIANNAINNPDGQAILTRAAEGTGTVDATVQSNTITIPVNGFDGIEVRAGSDPTTFTNKNCSYVLSNTVTNNSTQGGHALYVQAVSPGTNIQLQQKAGTNGGTNVANATALWSINSNTGATVDSYTEPGSSLQIGLGYVCLTPTNTVAPTIVIPSSTNTDEQVVFSTGRIAQPSTQVVAQETRTSKPAGTSNLTKTMSGETVTVSGVTMPLGKTFVVQFKARVNTPFPVNVCSVSNQAQISGTNFSSVNTNAAVTNINSAPVITSCQANINATTSSCVSSQAFAITATGCPAPIYTYTIVSSGQTITSPYDFPVGTTTVQAKASNVADEDVCTFTVTVTGTNATWVGTTNTDWHTASNWQCGAVPDITTNVTINSAANMPVLSADGAANTITLGSGATLTVNNGQTLQVNGDFASAGTIIADGTFNFSGSGEQAIPGAAYNNVIISGGGNKTLAANASIDGMLSFVSGTVTLQSNDLTLGASSLVTGNSSSSFIVTNNKGAVKKMGLGATGNSGNFVFPVGPSASAYTPVALSNAGTTDNFSVRVINDVYHGYTNETPTGSPITSDVVNKTWFVSEEVAGGSDVRLTLQWNSSDELPGFNRTMSYVSHNTGAAWLAGPVANAAGSDPYTRFLTNITSFSPFGVGSAGSALPVQLITFKGSEKGSANLLEWVAAAEQLKGYEVERSNTATGFAKIGEVAATNGTGVHQYSWPDNAPLQGANFYRLRLIHPDGSVSYGNVININRSAASPIVRVYPTPIINGKLNLQLSNLEKGRYSVSLYSSAGQLLYSTNLAHDGGSSTQTIQLPSSVSKGIYHLQMKKDDKVFNNNVVVQ